MRVSNSKLGQEQNITNFFRHKIYLALFLDLYFFFHFFLGGGVKGGLSTPCQYDRSHSDHSHQAHLRCDFLQLNILISDSQSTPYTLH